MHIAMAEVLKQPNWWALPENKAAHIGIVAIHATMPHKLLVEEFRALRRERGLSDVRTEPDLPA